LTRTTLRILAILLAGAVALASAGAAGVSPWWGLPLIPAVWFGLAALGRWLHALLVRRALERDRRRDRPSSASISTDAARRLRRIASGEAGFTADAEPLPDLERAAFFLGNPGDENAVVLDVMASTRASRIAIVAGLRVLHDESVAALGNPLHPLYLDADTLLPLMGHPTPRFFRHWRASRAWAERQALFDPVHAEECLAVRLVQARMPRAALTVLRNARRTRRRRSLRRLARLLVVQRLHESGDVGFPMDALGVWAPAVVLVMGRRLRELIPDTALVAAPRRGAASLESAVRHVPKLARELARLARETPVLVPHVASALAAVLDRPADVVRRDLEKHRLDARCDNTLVPHLRGLALLAERRPAEAAYEFETALERAGDFTAAAFSLAVARRRAGDPKKGAAALREHAILNPKNPDVPIYLARYLADGGDRNGARRAYREGIERFPDALQIRVAYAMDLAAWGEDSAAAEEFDFARRAQPGDARLALLAGRARLNAGRPREAVEPLEQAARHLRGGERAEAQYFLLSAFREQGLHDLAKPIADELVEGLGRGQETLLDEVAEYQEERHDFRRARRAQSRARRLRGDRW
jgi:predicted Zn-dependent protease